MSQAVGLGQKQSARGPRALPGAGMKQAVGLKIARPQRLHHPKKQQCGSRCTSASNLAMLGDSGNGLYECHFMSARIQYSFQTFRVTTHPAFAIGYSALRAK